MTRRGCALTERMQSAVVRVPDLVTVDHSEVNLASEPVRAASVWIYFGQVIRAYALLSNGVSMVNRVSLPPATAQRSALGLGLAVALAVSVLLPLRAAADVATDPFYSGTISFTRSFDYGIALDCGDEPAGRDSLRWEEFWTVTIDPEPVANGPTVALHNATVRGTLEYTNYQICDTADYAYGLFDGSGPAQVYFSTDGSVVDMELHPVGSHENGVGSGIPGSVTYGGPGVEPRVVPSGWTPNWVAQLPDSGAGTWSGDVAGTYVGIGDNHAYTLGASDRFTAALNAGSARVDVTRAVPGPVVTPTPTPTPTVVTDACPGVPDIQPAGTPCSPPPPVARCDVYWVAPGGTLRVGAATGLLRNDHDPSGLPIRPRVKVISFRRSSHPYTVGTDGALTLKTLRSDAGNRLVITYAVANSAGRMSDDTDVTVLVSARRPKASQLRPCTAGSDNPTHDLRGINKVRATATPAKTPEHIKILEKVIESRAYFTRIKRDRKKAPYKEMDWAQDGCSAPGAANIVLGKRFEFTPACIRHDFGYRNALWMGLFNKYKARVDTAFHSEMTLYCKAEFSGEDRADCVHKANLYYKAVKKFGGSSVPEVASMWDDRVRVRVVTVFQPADNFYVRGRLEDMSVDGYSVRLEVSAAQTGRNTPYRTISRNAGGAGTSVIFDYSFNGMQNLKGIFYKICIDSDRSDDEECSPRQYIDKPG